MKKKSISVVFLGTPQCVVPLLDHLCKHPRVARVMAVTQPAKPNKRGTERIDPPVAVFAKANSIPILQTDNVSEANSLGILREFSPDFFLTAAFGQILRKDFLDLAKDRVFNVHPSALPKYRGATPIQSALLDGLLDTSVTVCQTVSKMDAGPVFGMVPFYMGGDKTADILLEESFLAAIPLLDRLIEALINQEPLRLTEQVEAEATFCRKLKKEDGLLDLSLDAGSLWNRFRAFYPWPGCFVWVRGIGRSNDPPVKIDLLLKTYAENFFTPERLAFNTLDKTLYLRASRGSVVISSLKMAGKSWINAESFVNQIKSRGILLKELEFVDASAS